MDELIVRVEQKFDIIDETESAAKFGVEVRFCLFDNDCPRQFRHDFGQFAELPVQRSFGQRQWLDEVAVARVAL